MSRYHVGDIVRIRDDLNHTTCYATESLDGSLTYQPIVIEEMEAARGLEVKITRLHNNASSNRVEYHCIPLNSNINGIWTCFWVAGCFEPIDDTATVDIDWDDISKYLFG